MDAPASAPALDWTASPPAEAGAASSLAALAPGSAAKVAGVSLEDDLARWLAAVGIGQGDRVTVLRRAPFGGPIHLRTHAGGELAIARSLARAIRVVP